MGWGRPPPQVLAAECGLLVRAAGSSMRITPEAAAVLSSSQLVMAALVGAVCHSLEVGKLSAGLSYGEIAQITGLSRDVVRTNVRRLAKRQQALVFDGLVYARDDAIAVSAWRLASKVEEARRSPFA